MMNLSPEGGDNHILWFSVPALPRAGALGLATLSHASLSMTLSDRRCLLSELSRSSLTVTLAYSPSTILQA